MWMIQAESYDMPSPVLLDTNSYSILFQHPKSLPYTRLMDRIKSREYSSFFISEITSMEIHSVLGKYRRGAPAQSQQCNREIIQNGMTTKCSNVWIFPKRKKINAKIFRDFQKLILDIESQRGNIQATIIKLDEASIVYARSLLNKYADRFDFGSHDALITGSLISANEKRGQHLTLVTSDKSLKAVLREESIAYYDPAII